MRHCITLWRHHAQSVSSEADTLVARLSPPSAPSLAFTFDCSAGNPSSSPRAAPIQPYTVTAICGVQLSGIEALYPGCTLLLIWSALSPVSPLEGRKASCALVF